ncbi:hypothetical protein F5Y16DRAFT_398226 [Xylariaceae sp. FL0255]|nr:hypothetical protein F5Y16DRAFT_398226 [Xylariaceae sp. FL0255]
MPLDALSADAQSLLGRAESFAINIANELAEALDTKIPKACRDKIMSQLPSRLQEFALQIGYEGDSQSHRDIMWVAHNVSTMDYFGRLQWINDKFVVLHDSKERIAWLLDGPSALLHLVMVSLNVGEHNDFSRLILFDSKKHPLATPEPPEQFCGRSTAIEVMTSDNNLHIKIRRKFENRDPSQLEDDYYTFKDRVDDIFNILEQIIDHQEDNRPESIGMRILQSNWQNLEGFDFTDIAMKASDPYIPKGTKLLPEAKGWIEFVRELRAIVLFGDGFGDVLRPSSDETPCNSCFWNTSAVKGKDLLAVAMNDLDRLRIQGPEGYGSWFLKGGFWWEDPRKAFFACTCDSNPPSSVRIQALRKSLPSKKPLISTFTGYREGAVLFGANILRKEANPATTHRHNAIKTLNRLKVPKLGTRSTSPSSHTASGTIASPATSSHSDWGDTTSNTSQTTIADNHSHLRGAAGLDFEETAEASTSGASPNTRNTTHSSLHQNAELVNTGSSEASTLGFS